MKKNLKPFLLGAGSSLLVCIIIVALTVGSVFQYISYYAVITNQYDGEVNADTMHESILAGITDGLGDIHSSYISKDDVENFNQSLNTSYQGIGIRYEPNDVTGVAKIVNVLRNGPASEEDIYPGDIITEVNDEPITPENVGDLSNMIKANRDVHLVIYRPSIDADIIIDMQQNSYQEPSVHHNIIDSNDNQIIGYIKIDSFSNTTSQEFEDALLDLEESNITKLIIDVRNNGGGELSAVIDICNLIVPQDKPFLITKEDGKVIEEYISSLEEAKPYEIVGIQNERTASASEILMGAIKEINGSEIIGTTSYGKGSVQRLFPVIHTGGKTKITIQHWFTPNDNTIDSVGISPTIEIDSSELLYIVPFILDQELSLGLESKDVKQLNYYLNIIGYDVDSDSNVFSNKTYNALVAFQKSKGLNPTGILDVKTAHILYRETQAKYVNPAFNPMIEAAIGV